MPETIADEFRQAAHMRAMWRSHSQDSLKKEASKHTPMKMLWVWHVSTIMEELIEEWILNLPVVHKVWDKVVFQNPTTIKYITIESIVTSPTEEWWSITLVNNIYSIWCIRNPMKWELETYEFNS